MLGILIVDDHLEVRRSLRKLFESEGFICSEAGDGVEALGRAELEKPDLIVLDLAMPIMTGLDAAPQLKRILPTTPIILFTLHSSEEMRKLAMEAGIAAVISKDQAPTQLMKTVHSLLKAS